MKTDIMLGMHLLLAALAISISLVLAAWHERPATPRTPRRNDARLR